MAADDKKTTTGGAKPSTEEKKKRVQNRANQAPVDVRRFRKLGSKLNAVQVSYIMTFIKGDLKKKAADGAGLSDFEKNIVEGVTAVFNSVEAEVV